MSHWKVTSAQVKSNRIFDQNNQLSQLLFQAPRRNEAPPQTSNRSSSCLTSLIRDVFLSLPVEPKAFSNRSCFFLWISTILSSTESFTINCSSQQGMKTGRKQGGKTLATRGAHETHRCVGRDGCFALTFVTTTFLVCPSRWQRSMHCSSEAGFHAWDTHGTISASHASFTFSSCCRDNKGMWPFQIIVPFKFSTKVLNYGSALLLN